MCVCILRTFVDLYVSQLSLTVAKVHPSFLNMTNIAPSPLLLTGFLPSVCFHWPRWKRITSHLHALHEECVIGLNATAQAFFFSSPLSLLLPLSSACNVCDSVWSFVYKCRRMAAAYVYSVNVNAPSPLWLNLMLVLGGGGGSHSCQSFLHANTTYLHIVNRV